MAKNSGHIRNVVRDNNAPNYAANNQVIVAQNGFRQDYNTQTEANNKIASIIADMTSIGHPTDGKPFKVGELSSSIISKFESLGGSKVVNAEVYMSAGSMTHHQTGTKAQRGKTVPITDFSSFASNIGNMDIYRNRDVLIFTDYNNKFIVHVNRSIKINKQQTKVCCHISSSKVIDKNEFTKYDPIYKK